MKYSKKYILAILCISLFGEIYFYPYQNTFRFSAGVIAMSIILLYTNLKEIYLGFFTGISVFALRGILNYFQSEKALIEIFKNNLPGGFYYIFFGFLAAIFALRKNKSNPFRTIITLFLMDVIANIIESIMRQNLYLDLFQYIITIALVRSIISYMVFFVFYNQKVLLLNREHRKRYAQQSIILSSIQAEMFYLDKTMKDIEDVMSKSYKLYENNRDNKEIRELALDIAREVHEIKKDYYRLAYGLREIPRNFEKDNSMSFKDISIIIKENIQRYLSQNNKNIDINFIISDDISIVKFYPLFTILNNLIINSVDSSTENGKIEIIQRINSQDLIIEVIDNGYGMDEDIIPYIFNPGFTTKFDEDSGEASTGIGLPHVKKIIEDLGGKVKIESQVDIGTKFIVSIPLNSLGR